MKKLKVLLFLSDTCKKAHFHDTGIIAEIAEFVYTIPFQTNLNGSCLKTGQHFIFALLYIHYCLRNVYFLIPYQRYLLFKFFMYTSQRFYLIMILIMENFAP